MKRNILALVLACLFQFTARQAAAQDTRGAILGQVVDSSGGVVAGVTVRATNLASNVSVSAQSNAEGNYELPYLLPGEYAIVSEHAGFKSFRRDRVEVRIGDRISIPIRMEVGQVSEQVTVTAETPLLETASANVGQVIDSKRLADLPTRMAIPSC